MEPQPILIIEDDPNIRELLAELLEGEGFPVRTAANGEAGLVALAQGPLPKLILLDLMMPGMNGWDFLRERALRPEWEAVPVVVMSAAAKAAEGIPDDVRVFPKPLNFAPFMAAVREYCLLREKTGADPRRTLLEYAVESGWLTADRARRIEAQGKLTGPALMAVLKRAGLDEEQLAFLEACMLRLSFVCLDHVLVTTEALAAFPHVKRLANRAFPLHFTAEFRPLTLYLSLSPRDARPVSDRLSHELGYSVVPVIASPGAIMRAIRLHADLDRPAANHGIPAEWLDLDSPATTMPRGEVRPIDSRFLHPGWHAAAS